jgi:adenylate cyclase, class 2
MFTVLIKVAPARRGFFGLPATTGPKPCERIISEASDLVRMIEIEIKARADHDALKKMLKQEGAALEKTVEQTDIYFNAPDRDFGKTDEALRLRNEGGQIFLTYKGKKLDPLSKTRKEVEVEIADFDKMEDILLSLGYRKTLQVRKVREIYHMEGMVLCLDRVYELGDFVELETLAVGESDIPARRDSLINTMRRLGITGDLIRESYLEMLLDKKVP